MMDTIAFLHEAFPAWILIFFRIGGLLVFAPFFGSRNIPVRVKAAFALVTALALSPVVPRVGFIPPAGLGGMVAAAAAETAVGVVLGLFGSMLFTAFQLAGQLIGQQMGFALANVIDPISEVEVSILGQFEFFLGILIYLLIDGHLALFAALVDTFRTVPLGAFVVGDTALSELLAAFGGIFVLAVRMALPVMAALMLTTVGMGFIARTVPQMNVMIVAFPVQIGVGMLVLMAALPATMALVGGISDRILVAAARLAGGG